MSAESVMAAKVPETVAWRDELRAVGVFAFELPQTARPGMRVPARVYADDTLLATILGRQTAARVLGVDVEQVRTIRARCALAAAGCDQVLRHVPTLDGCDDDDSEWRD